MILRIAYTRRWLQPSILVFIAMVWLMSMNSCTEGVIARLSKDIPEKGWNISDSVTFEVWVDDTLQPVDFSLSVENQADYRYSNLLLFLDTYYPDGGHTRDTLECFLANKAGEWTGKGIGSSKQSTFLVKPSIRFPAPGQYKFVFTQAMRNNPLQGITQMGIAITEIE